MLKKREEEMNQLREKVMKKAEPKVNLEAKLEMQLKKDTSGLAEAQNEDS